MKLREGDVVVSCDLAKPGTVMLFVSSSGHGKRTKLDVFHAQNRGGQGVRGMKVTESRGGSGADRLPPYNQSEMIYCVIPRELEAELYEKMVEYYKDNPNVTVIVDRREGPDRRSGKPEPEFIEKRQTRDRRRPRIPGTFPDTDLPGE